MRKSGESDVKEDKGVFVGRWAKQRKEKVVKRDPSLLTMLGL